MGEQVIETDAFPPFPPFPCPADPETSARLVHSYNRFVERIVAYELDTRAFDTPLLDVRSLLLLYLLSFVPLDSLLPPASPF